MVCNYKQVRRCTICSEEVDPNDENFNCTECSCPFYTTETEQHVPLDFNVDDSKSTYVPEHNNEDVT